MSYFKMDSIGIVANDKKVGENTILVFPTEHLSEYEGVISEDEEEEGGVMGVVSSGLSMLAGGAERKVTLKADWLNVGGSNRVTAPDVMKGETVILYRMGDADRWFWSMMRGETDLRRKESVVHLYGNTEEHGVTLDHENSYHTTISTKDKKIHLHTSNNDEEAAAFDILLKTDTGVLEVKDSNGNYLRHDAKNGTLETNHNSSVTIHSPEITLDGNVTITGNLHTKGTSDLDGDVTTKGRVKDTVGDLTGLAGSKGNDGAPVTRS